MLARRRGKLPIYLSARDVESKMIFSPLTNALKKAYLYERVVVGKCE